MSVNASLASAEEQIGKLLELNADKKKRIEELERIRSTAYEHLAALNENWHNLTDQQQRWQMQDALGLLTRTEEEA